MSPVSGRGVLAAAIVVAAVTAVAAGLWIVGSPGEARLARIDGRRVADLEQIATSVDLYWNTHGRLPVSLDESASGGRMSVPGDPSTGKAYAYRVVDTMHYEVCATFDRASGLRPAMNARPFAGHGAGRQCFTIEVRDSSRPRSSR